MSIAPSRAQYSFMYTYSTPDDEMPNGMMQASDGRFILYGMGAERNFITSLNAWGSVLWELRNSPGGNCRGLLELDDHTLVAGGQVTDLLQDPQLTMLKLDGSVIIDTVYRIAWPHSGGLTQMVNGKKYNYLVSVGFGDVGSLYFQRTNYNGKILWHKHIPYGGDYRFRHLFKHIEREEYLLFGERHVMCVDSMGNFIRGISGLFPTEGVEIWDIVQLQNGTFAAVIYSRAIGNYIQFFDVDGNMTNRKIISSRIGVSTINRAKDNGLVVGGSYIMVYDSADNLVFEKPFLTVMGDTMEIVSIAQAADGGFYGCGKSFAKFDTRSNDIYAFKTTPEGEILHTGLQESNGRLNVQVMPNPSEGVFKVSGEFRDAQVSIINLLGQEVLKDKILSGSNLDAISLETGIYLMTVTSGEKKHVQKIFISK